MQYQPTFDSIQQHPVPDWYHDAKLGIIVHWGLYSVPGWSPIDGKALKESQRLHSRNSQKLKNLRAEWYLNHIRIPDSQSRSYHEATYGTDFDYDAFVPLFNQAAKGWEPHTWATLFRQAGARYVVLTAKHHEGFLLWPSAHPNPFKPNYHAKRDLVGELAEAVRSEGLQMGLYYSGGLDWTFTEEPIIEESHIASAIPQEQLYVDYCMAHWRELIARYQPSILWNDMGMPTKVDLPNLFAEYYNIFPEGLVNNRFEPRLSRSVVLPNFPPFRRWLSRMVQHIASEESSLYSKEHCDFTTLEYKTNESIAKRKWEAFYALGNSFGYNRNEESENFLSTQELIYLFTDIVSKNGNLLLNVGPTAEGRIPYIQQERLLALGEWLNINGDALFETRPWIQSDGICMASNGEIQIRFTQKKDSLYVILLGIPAKGVLKLSRLQSTTRNTTIRLLGRSVPLAWQDKADHLQVIIPTLHELSTACAIQITPQPQINH